MIRVVLVDDQHLVRAGLRALLDRAEDITVVGEAADGAAGVTQAIALRPDVVLMDIRMPGTDGLAATRAIVGDPRLAGVRVVVLTTFDADEHVFEAIRAGASGFLLKDVEPDELRRGVRVVAGGEALLSPSVTRRVIAELAARRRVAGGDRSAGSAASTGLAASSGAAGLGDLTEREREVLAQVARGLSNGEIAEELRMRPATARTHVSRILTKLGVRDRAQLVVLAYETGLVEPGGPDSRPGGGAAPPIPPIPPIAPMPPGRHGPAAPTR